MEFPLINVAGVLHNIKYLTDKNAGAQEVHSASQWLMEKFQGRGEEKREKLHADLSVKLLSILCRVITLMFTTMFAVKCGEWRKVKSHQQMEDIAGPAQWTGKVKLNV